MTTFILVNESESYDEKSILLLVSEGDERAFASLFKQSSDKLVGYLLQLLGSEDEARDILQKVFLKIWQKRGELAGLESFDNYLFIIARNYAYDHFRKKAREWKFKNSFSEKPEVISEDTEEQLKFRRLQQIHHEAIEQLSPQQKKVYMLSREEGLTHKQIGDALGIAAETVKKHLLWATQSVRQYVSNHYEIWLLAMLAPVL